MRWLVDDEALGRACVDAAQSAGLQVVGKLFHAFPVPAAAERQALQRGTIRAETT